MRRPFVSTFGQLRVIPDAVIILVGVLPLAYLLFGIFPHVKAQEIDERAHVHMPGAFHGDGFPMQGGVVCWNMSW